MFCDSSMFICVICGQFYDSIQPTPAFNNHAHPAQSSDRTKKCDSPMRRIYDMLTVPLTEPEELTQRKSKGPIEGFVCNGL
jgi:hypothetical protein